MERRMGRLCCKTARPGTRPKRCTVLEISCGRLRQTSAGISLTSHLFSLTSRTRVLAGCLIRPDSLYQGTAAQRLVDPTQRRSAEELVWNPPTFAGPFVSSY